MSTLKLLKEIRESGNKTPYATLLRQARKFGEGGQRLPFDMPLKSANPYTMSRYDQPKVGNTILPDVNRPELMNTGATEYKMGVGFDNGEVQIPTIVNGQYLDNENAVRNYLLTKEKFKDMTDPSSYSKYYDMITPLGLGKDNRKFEEGGFKEGFKNSNQEESKKAYIFAESSEIRSPKYNIYEKTKLPENLDIIRKNYFNKAIERQQIY